jgi:drug/metabolite transporter (DMT)-like permease
MTDKRYTAVLATLFDSASDATLDYAISRHNIHKMVFLLSLIAGIGQVAIGAFIGIDCTLAALPYVALHGILILLGYICFLKALKYTPIALIGLVQSSELFFTTIIDCMLGYLTLSARFLALLSLFVFAIALFYINCIKNENTSVKEVKPIGIILTLGTMFLYVAATYLIKVSAAYGASEITLNLAYYVAALPYFGYLALKGKDDDTKNTANPRWYNGFYFLAFAIGILETIFYVLETFSFINDTPTIVMAIKQMGIFVMFFLSVLFKTDKFTPQKLLALILGFIAITGLYFN